MAALDLIPDFGERVGTDGEPVDELFAVLAMMPPDDGPEIVVLAAAIANQRCHGRGDIAGALRRWRAEMLH